MGGLPVQFADLHIIPLFPQSSLALPSATCGVPKSRTSLLQSLLLVLGRESYGIYRVGKGPGVGLTPPNIDFLFSQPPNNLIHQLLSLSEVLCSNWAPCYLSLCGHSLFFFFCPSGRSVPVHPSTSYLPAFC